MFSHALNLSKFETFDTIVQPLVKGDLEGAVKAQREVQPDLRNAPPEFTAKVRACVAGLMLVPGYAPEEIVAMGQELLGEQADFSEELALLSDPLDVDAVQSGRTLKREGDRVVWIDDEPSN